MQAQTGTIFLTVASDNDEEIKHETVTAVFGGIAGISNVSFLGKAQKSGLNFAVKYEKKESMRHLFNKVLENQLVLLEMRIKEASLEDTFRRLTL